MIFLAAYPIFDAFFEVDEDQIWNGWQLSRLFFFYQQSSPKYMTIR